MSEGDKTQTDVVAKAEYESAVERARKFEAEVGDLKKRMEKYNGIDPDRVKADREALATLERERASGKPEEIAALVEKAKKEAREEAQKELDASRDKIQTLSAQNHELLVVSTVFSEHAGDINQDVHGIFKEIIRKSCATDEDGNIIVKDDKGNIRHSAKNPAQKMTAAEFVAELKEKTPSFVRSTSKTGGKEEGTKSSGTNGSNSTTSFGEILAMGEQKGIETMAKMTPNELKASLLAK